MGRPRQVARGPLALYPSFDLVKMEDLELRATVRRVLSETAVLDVPLDTLDDRADLYGAGLASVTSVSVMVALEDEFEIEIPDRLLTRQLFRSIDSLSFAVTECLRSREKA